jgi:hypothetical protein
VHNQQNILLQLSTPHSPHICVILADVMLLLSKITKKKFDLKKSQPTNHPPKQCFTFLQFYAHAALAISLLREKLKKIKIKTKKKKLIMI